MQKEVLMFRNSENITNYIINFKIDSRVKLPNVKSKSTQVEDIKLNDTTVKQYINEFWTSGQRQASSLQEISYRACFKPQLPRFFINLLTNEGDIIYDPFSGRGTTPIEAGLLNRNIVTNDVNPISKIFTYPRLFIPTLQEIEKRLESISFDYNVEKELDLSMFYHKDTESEIVSLRNYLYKKRTESDEDCIDNWIRMVATNRLTGHSPGFFSVYTLPPNQAITRERQIKINQDRNQTPPYRDVKKLIYNKSKALLKDVDVDIIHKLSTTGNEAQFLEKDARYTQEIESDSVKLTVTSPPFLNIVQYSKDNWLRCWFNRLNEKEIEKNITMTNNIDDWCHVMQDVFHELYRITQTGGWVAFEVGEVKNGKIRLDEYVADIGLKAKFNCFGILVNLQSFTKTSNIWGVKNNSKGTNTNRIVLFYKE